MQQSVRILLADNEWYTAKVSMFYFIYQLIFGILDRVLNARLSKSTKSKYRFHCPIIQRDDYLFHHLLSHQDHQNHEFNKTDKDPIKQIRILFNSSIVTN